MQKTLKIITYIIIVTIALIIVVLAFFYKSDIPTTVNEEKYFTEESRYITVDQNKLHIRITGQGPALLLIHGSFSSLHTWEVWQRNLENDFTTISVDLPGHGLTGANPQNLYTTDYYSDLLWKLVDQLNYESISIAGNSMGGQVAYKMALMNPNKVKQLILLNSSGVRNQKRVIKTNDGFSVFDLINNPISAQLMKKVTPKFLVKMSLKQVYYDHSKFNESKLERYYDLLLNEGNREATMVRFQQKSDSRFEELSNLEIPTLIIWGEHDNWIPVENAYKFNKIIPNSTLKIYENTGHVPMEEIPLETSQLAKEFILNH
ncbi:alpha/beta fold hydrolase [Marivirga arenosa]|uniref:Alpha/beta hydrolase n=1 Tax=Marivirga arenosa TaxID=3059076 RepID=A0AA51X3J1_9BACT|nr:alpha/beta hydrolase [Marivirga sp. BKB1-2]WNB16956.1 alpha/beta hydrolase [Marivirga sp. BKB1-2]